MASSEKCGRAELSTIMGERIRMECENQEGFLRREATTVKLKVMAEAKLDQAF